MKISKSGAVGVVDHVSPTSLAAPSGAAVVYPKREIAKSGADDQVDTCRSFKALCTPADPGGHVRLCGPLLTEEISVYHVDTCRSLSTPAGPVDLVKPPKYPKFDMAVYV